MHEIITLLFSEVKPRNTPKLLLLVFQTKTYSVLTKKTSYVFLHNS